MIGCYFTGRLGNQFFRYAYVRALWESRGRKDELVFNFRRVLAGKGTGFEDSLQYFRVLPYRTDNRSLVLRYGSGGQKRVYGSFRTKEKFCELLRLRTDILSDYRQRLLEKGIVVLGTADGNIMPTVAEAEHVFVNGYFENRAYFDHIRPILLDELQPRHAPLAANAALYEAIAHSESVCVTIRRGDYLSTQYKKGFYVCDENYFNHALTAIRQRVDNPLFVFFSDDIDWVRTHIPLPEGSLCERGKDPVWEKMRLMSACKHFIISNSSFSWWAQYLSQNEGKMVVSPTRWFNNPDWVSYLLDDSFVRVE